MLFETFVREDDINDYRKYFEGYQLLWVPAIKKAQFGRAIGGNLYGYRHSIASSVEYKYYGDKCLIKVANNKFQFLIIPIYLNCNSWENDFEELSCLLREYHLNSVLIMGDFNARLANNQYIPDEFNYNNSNINQFRQSKDTTVNTRGLKFLELCDTQNLIVLNGRMSGDNEGEFTFIDSKGRSVIDLCAVSLDLIQHMHNFEVLSHIYSDHMPIVLTVLHVRAVSGATVIPLLPKLNWSDKKKDKYQGEIQQILSRVDTTQDTVQRTLDSFTDCVRKAAGIKPVKCNINQIKKKPWYDYECHKLRRKTFKLLNLHRLSNSNLIKKQYLLFNTRYKALCELKRKQYYMDVTINFKNVRDSKQFWDLVNKFKPKIPCCGLNVRFEDFVNYFKMLLNPPLKSNRVMYAEPYTEDPTLDKEIDFKELLEAISKAKCHKAPGPDQIPVEYYKNAPKSFLIRILGLFNKILSTGEIPKSFTNSIVFPLHKKGDINNVNNYRGISFMDAISKLFTFILLSRLNNWVEINRVLKEFQAGFRKHYSAVDNIFNLISIIKLKESKKRKTYVMFVDFQAAFDTVDREALYYKLHNYGISSKFMKIIKGLYKDTTAAVWHKEGVSESFETRIGLKQGCLLSPLLFSLYLNDLQDSIGGGVLIGNLKVKLLAYADDVCIISDSAVGLQSMINDLEKYCCLWNLTVNLKKSNVMIFKLGGGRLAKNEKWVYKGQPIEIVKEYKYLGVKLTSNLLMKRHLSERITSAKFGVNSLWNNFFKNNEIPISAKYEVFSAVLRAVVCYASQIWGFERYESVEKFARFFIKRIFRLPESTPTYMLHLETGLNEIYIHTLSLHFAYIKKVMNLPEGRWPKILMHLAIKRNVWWFKSWKKMGEENGCRFGLGEEEGWWAVTDLLKDKIIEASKTEWHLRAQQSHFELYPLLSKQLGDKQYITDTNNGKLINLIFKVRCNQLNLNYKFWKIDSVMCPICNLNEIEDIKHFLGKCPMYNMYRIKYLKKIRLDETDMIDILNGKDWEDLYNYVKEAQLYRHYIIQEYT